MGMLHEAVTDPKREVGAYLVLSERHMYEVIEPNDDGSAKVKNCQTGYVFRLSVKNMEKARLVLPLPDDAMETFEAAFDAAPSIPETAP